MQQDQRDYFRQRAEIELVMARDAGSAAAAAAHRALAEAYAERVRGVVGTGGRTQLTGGRRR